MKLSFKTDLENGRAAGINGFGSATNSMLDALQTLGYHVEFNSTRADVELIFAQPLWQSFDEGPSDAYRIHYFPWESTSLDKEWAQLLNRADEVWTPSPLIASWMPGMGITKPIYVYEHGIDKIWQPIERKKRDITRFLMVGAEAARKNGWLIPPAFRNAFPGNDHVGLTIKSIQSGWNNVKILGRVNYITDLYSKDEMVNLFNTHQVYVYPSAGEGWGLTPMQAIASGMPTITLPAWAPYREFLDPRLAIDSELVKSSHEIHPGKYFRPDTKSMIRAMQIAFDDYDSVAQFAYENAFKVHERYSWERVTQDAFGALEQRLNAR